MMNSVNGSRAAPAPSTFEGNSAVSLFFAAVIPFLFLKMLSFFKHTWPNIIYRVITSCLGRQTATVVTRVTPNRLIQDNLMARNIMDYVSYCYKQTLRQCASACDAISIADYEYFFIYENVANFNESWIPSSARYKTLFGRTIASAMELSVVPTVEQAIQVEPGLFVRLVVNRRMQGNVYNEESRSNESDSNESDSNDWESRRVQRGQAKGSANVDQMSKLNEYVFYDMRKYTKNMDRHTQPLVNDNSDKISFANYPFDESAPHHRGHLKKEKGAESDETFNTNRTNYEPNYCIVIEYRRPLPYETAQALCTGSTSSSFGSSTTSGVMAAYDETRAAGDVIEGFLERVHAWYLGNVAQREKKPLMIIYPTPVLSLFAEMGKKFLSHSHMMNYDFKGRSYALDCGLSTAEAHSPSTTAATARTAPAGGETSADAAAGSAPSVGKTFKSLFFPAKARVLSIVDDFVHERGCYGVPGVTARLNFFLHGAPGTGKTSFVKALARHLRRNLVIVSMSEILTVNELRQLLQPFELADEADDGHVGHDSDDSDDSDESDHNYFSVQPHQSIYVFEDFDAIGDAWASLKRDQDERKTKKEQAAVAEAAETAAEAEGAKEEKKVKGQESGESNESEGERDSTYASSSGRDSGDDSGYDDSDDDSNDSSITAVHEKDNYMLSDKQIEKLSRKRLTVEHFLDLFNGLSLSDSFIAVFTTNHPERVHPLITSSNMMDVTVEMGMLNDACAIEMVEYYFANELAAEPVGPDGRRHLTKAQIADLRAALEAFKQSSDCLSGAVLEKMCIECNTVELLTELLRTADRWDVSVF